jgi:hypothetical protein
MGASSPAIAIGAFIQDDLFAALRSNSCHASKKLQPVCSGLSFADRHCRCLAWLRRPAAQAGFVSSAWRAGVL